MKKIFLEVAALALLNLCGIAQAITIDTVPIGDAGNAADTRVMSDSTSGYGSVGYKYNIGEYEVTGGEYTAFLNAVAKKDTYGLYNTNMDTAVSAFGCNIQRNGISGSYSYSVAPDWANRPVNYVSYWDSCRFANWLNNGQPTGAQDASTTEHGAYTLDGYTGSDGRNIGRNTGWTWAVTSESEWYKAAYYKGGDINAGYWLYPTQSDAIPANQVLAIDPGNSANYNIYNGTNNYSIGSPYYRTEVGAFANSGSAYGTFDQGGNVWEMNEGVAYQGTDFAYRSLRGGSYDIIEPFLRAFNRGNILPNSEFSVTGFRVSGVFGATEAPVGPTVPEPSAIMLGILGLTGISGFARRRLA